MRSGRTGGGEGRGRKEGKGREQRRGGGEDDALGDTYEKNTNINYCFRREADRGECVSRILITGAGGFVGSHLMDAFGEDSENETIGFDNWLTGRKANTCGVEFLDITKREKLYEVANAFPPEVVIHCAASYSDPDKWHRDTDTNVSGCINAAAVAKHHGAHLLYFQTILPPVSSYAISKLAGEQYLRLSGVPLTVFRMANIYGPRNISGPIPVFYKRITEGKPCLVVDTTRDMVFIDDLVRLVKTCVEQGITGTYDVCSGVQTPIMEMYQAIARELGHRDPRR